MTELETTRPRERGATPTLGEVAVDPAVGDFSVSEKPSMAYPEAVSSRPRWLIVLGLFVAVLVLGGGAAAWLLWLKPAPTESIQIMTVTRRSFPVVLRERGELEAANSIELKSEIEGRATIIYLIDEGTQAKKGDLLVELASDEIDEKVRDAEIREATSQSAYDAAVNELDILRDENTSKIRKAELDVRLADLALEKYREGEAVELRQDARLALDKAKSVLQRTKDTLEDSRELFAQGFLTKIELEDDRFAHYEAELELKKAQLALEVLEKYTIPMSMQENESKLAEAHKELDRTRKSAAAAEAKSMSDVAAKKSELQLTQDKLAKYRDQKSKSRIVAPADGLVVYSRGESWFRSETQITKGTQVHERQSLIQLPDVSKMKVVVRVHEAQTEHLRLDLPATIEIEGVTGRQFAGKVSKIAVLADSQNRWLNPNLKEYQTEVMLDGQFAELKPGATARVEILLAKLDNVVAVPVQAVFAKGTNYYVFVNHGGVSEPVRVVPGMASNEFLEVKEGISPGDRVHLAITDEMKLKLPDEEMDGDMPTRPRGQRGSGRNRRPATQPATQPVSQPAAEPAAKPG